MLSCESREAGCEKPASEAFRNTQSDVAANSSRLSAGLEERTRFFRNALDPDENILTDLRKDLTIARLLDKPLTQSPLEPSQSAAYGGAVHLQRFCCATDLSGSRDRQKGP